jgi:valyl-tRNA synthetase
VLTQDEDVLDTWFSSALWPFSTLGWPEKTASMATFYPTSVLVTGFDIIFFWVARMVMMGLKFTGEVPFKHVYITGLIRDSHGQKMSKSKGNVLDPIDVVDGISLPDLLAKRSRHLMQPEMAEKVAKQTRAEFPQGIPAHGTDALRFTFCALAATGRDIRFDLNRLAGYRNFCNKIWNAARYVLMQMEGESKTFLAAPESLSLGMVDRWILSQLQGVIEQTHAHVKTYRFDLLAGVLYEFTWNTFCDWYIELSKPVLLGDDQQAAYNTRYTLVYVLEQLLRLMHPIIPFITEEIWQQIAPLRGIQATTIMEQSYPVVNQVLVDSVAVDEIQWIQTVVTGVRTMRSEMNISPAQAVPLLLRKGQAIDRDYVTRHAAFLNALIKLENITWLEASETPPEAATALAGELELLIPLAGLIDKAAERTRLEKEIDKIAKQLVSSQGRLANENYLKKAPEQVVKQEQARVEQWQADQKNLQQKLAQLVG